MQSSHAVRALMAGGVALGLAACSGATAVTPSASSPGAAGLPMGADAAIRANILASQGRGTLPATQGARAFMSPANVTGSHVIYSGNYSNNTVTIYPLAGTNPAPIGTISTGISNPERLFVDKGLKLYVSDGNPGSIAVFKPGATSPYLSITNGVSSPTGVTVGPDGTVYSANVGNGTVTEYAKGATSPKLTIALTNEAPENLAVDAANNLYIQYLGGTLGSGVIEVAPGQTSGKDLGLVIGSAGALTIDSLGNIVILDTALAKLDVFKPGQTKPSKSLSLGYSPFELSMNAIERSVFISTIVGSGFAIQVVGYPGMKAATFKINPTAGDWPLAVAPDNVH